MNEIANETELSFGTRLWFAWVCFFRVLFDGGFASRAFAVRERMPELPPPEKTRPEKPAAPSKPGVASAHALLALLQREGRLVDFLEEDVAGFPDADIGAAARVVHDGCRKALREHARLVAIRSEAEGARVTLPGGFDADAVKLTGNVTGDPPFTGTLTHRGWRVESLELPESLPGHDTRIVAQAEVEL